MRLLPAQCQAREKMRDQNALPVTQKFKNARVDRSGNQSSKRAPIFLGSMMMVLIFLRSWIAAAQNIAPLGR
jgi:hypothetical protein